MGKIKDITNQRFGKLLVLENAGKLDNRRYYWKCQCDCGNIITVLGTSLRSGNTKSCGCGKYDGIKNYNLKQSQQNKIKPGTKFGKLTVIKDIGYKEQTSGHKRLWYLCQCDCGNKKEVMGNLLKQGQVISCGKCLTSKGEYLICKILNELNISYDHDIIYPPLEKETGRKLRFDFIIYNKDKTINRIIEFDGRQHYTGPDNSIWSHNKDTLETIQEKDNLKNLFCQKYNIPLIRIPYWITPTKENIFSNEFLFNKGDDECD